MIKVTSKKIVLDNVVIIDFGKLDSNFVLLNKILSGYDVIVTPEVQSEPRIGMDISKLDFRTVGYSTDEDYLAARSLSARKKGLTAADISCIIIAKKVKGYCATNGKAERQAAVAHGVQVIGSLGLLKYGVAGGILQPDQAIQICDIFVRNHARFEKRLVIRFKHEMSKL